MPGLAAIDDAPRKRKRQDEEKSDRGALKQHKLETRRKDGADVTAHILLLEEQVLQSRQHYNNIVSLQKLVGDVDKKPKTATLAAVSLCRIFCRLIAGEELSRRKDTNDTDAQVTKWLRQRLRDYTESIATWLGSPDAGLENTAVTLLMRIVKAEASQEMKKADQAWRTDKSSFVLLVEGLLEKFDAEGARQEFAQKYVEEYDDVRFHTMIAIKQYFSIEEHRVPTALSNALDLLKRIEGVPESEEQLEDWYGRAPEPETHHLLSLNAHRKAALECWLSIFRSPLTAAHRKLVLNIMTGQILPWFSNRLELLTDFLTDSFNEGGAMSLLALSGIFHLMTQRNLDYPDFYPKLYSLLDDEVLHSKHRNRFFRLLDQFMASTHLPTAMVASFIKRLARLSLQAPPGAIVWTVPWVYNMLKRHPACTFMLHRSYHPTHLIYASHPEYTEEGMDDPFDALQPDPMLTNAIDSSLWELHTLQDHWHPSVATLAKILGEQFTKRDYQLEDFLDHSYAGLIDAELGKEIKKAPEVEWEIPKRIVSDEDGGLNELGGLLWSAIQA